jgi:hypothetical protein
MWSCANCKEVLEDQFDACWNCGYSRAGELELHFTREPVLPEGDSPLEKSLAEHMCAPSASTASQGSSASRPQAPA